MKKLNGFRKMMAWVLALMMVLGSVCAALAEDPQPTDLTALRDVEKEGEGDVTGVIADSSAVSADSVSATTTGNATATGVKATNGTVIIGADEDASGNVTAKAPNSGVAVGVDASGSEVTASGDVTAEGEREAIGVIADSSAVSADSVSATSDCFATGVRATNSTVIIGEDEGASGKVWASGGNGDVAGIIADSSEVRAGYVLAELWHDANQLTATGVKAKNSTVTIGESGDTSGDVGAYVADRTSDAIGIAASGNSVVTAYGNITAEGNNDVTGVIADSSVISADSVSATTYGDNATATGVKATGGMVIIGEEEGASGDVTAMVDHYNYCTGDAVGIDASGNSNVTAYGKVTAEGTVNVTGISADSSTVKADSVSVNQTGNMGDVYGVYADNATVIIGADQKAAGGVTVKSKSDSYDQYGIYAEGNADVTVVKGNVDLSAKYGNAIYVQNGRSGAVATVTVKEGNVAGHDSSQGIKILSFNSGKGIVAVENGTVESETQGINVMAASGGQNLVTVQGDVSGNEKGIYAYSNGNESSNTVIAQSDVKGGDNGTGLDLSARNGGVNHILVEGTLSGGTAITLENDDAAADSTVTVWAAESKGDLVAGEIGVSTDTINAFTKAINYIVKLSGSLTNNNVSTDNNKTVLVTEENNIFYGDTSEDYKYHTAKEEEDVTLSFQLREGEGLDGVYYNAEDKDTEGKVKEGANLLTVENGLTAVANAVNTFTLKMLRGGGMLLGLKTHTHEYEFVKREKEPTCTETGADVYKCKYCDATITETVAANPDNHTLANGDAKAVTCTEDGWEAYQYCTQCDYSTKVVIPAGHDFSVDVAAKAATCEEAGYTAHKECSRCHEKNNDYQVIKAKDHEFKGQFTADKKTHWYACKNCDAKKDEANHILGTPVKENEQLAKNGAVKSYEEVTYCTVCGAELSRETILGQDAIHNPNAGEADIAEYESMTGNDIDLDAIPMPMDVSSDNDDVVLEKLANCPDALKETAKQELAALKRSGYKIDCGCVAWPKSDATAACTLKLSEKDVPDGAQIFVNGAAVQAERKDGYYYFDITLPAVVLVAHK